MQRRPLHQLNRINRTIPPAIAALGRHHNFVSRPVRPDSKTDICPHKSQWQGKLVPISNDRRSLQYVDDAIRNLERSALPHLFRRHGQPDFRPSRGTR